MAKVSPKLAELVGLQSPDRIDAGVAERESEHSAWGAPVNLGPQINIEHDEFCPSPAGRALDFRLEPAGRLRRR